MKIAVYSCFKNEIDNVDAWAETVADADFVTVLDTGSTDGTQHRLGHALMHVGVKGFHIHDARITPWRFDVGLNTALALVPEDIDVCIQLAADERLSEGWRKAFPDINDLPLGPKKFTYFYEFTPDFKFYHDRIHTRFGYVWRYPFHEGVYPVLGSEFESRVTLDEFIISQTQIKTVDRLSRDNALAEIALREYPDDPRMIFYVGRQFMYAGQFRRALAILKRYEPEMKKLGRTHPVEQSWCAAAIEECKRNIIA